MGWKDRAKRVEPQAAPDTGGSGTPETEPLPVVPEPAPVPTPSIGQGTAWGRGVSQGLTSNWSDEALGWLASKVPSLNVSWERLGEQWGDILEGKVPRASDAPQFGSYEEARDYFRALNRASEQQQPAAYRIGEVTGGVTQAALLGPRPVGPGALLGPSAGAHALNFLGAPGVGAGVASGALAGAGGSEAEDVEGLAADTTKGGLIGGVASTAGPLAGRGLAKVVGGASEFLGLGKGVVNPTPAAKALEERGVNLTLGQQDPVSAFGQLEAANTSTAGLGPILRGQRQRGVESWQQAAMDQGLPPGLEPPKPGMSLQAQQARSYEGFDDAYSPIRQTEVPPYTVEAVPGQTGPSGDPLRRVVTPEEGVRRAVNDPETMATPDIQAAAQRYLEHQFALIPQEAYEPGGRVSVNVLQHMRSNIRDKIRQSLTGPTQNYERAGILASAEQYITDMIEAGLSPEQQAALRAADKQYAQHKVLEDALFRAGDKPGGFTPFQLEQGIKKGTESGSFVRGEVGGDLRELSRAGREVFEQVPPETGVRLLAAGPLKYATSTGIAAANAFGPLRRAALGQTGLQEVVRDVTSREGAERVSGVVMPELLKAAGRSSTDTPRQPGAALKSIAASQIMGPYAHELALAQSHGDDALVTYDFMKSQTDPEYMRLKRQAAGATAP